MLDVQPFRGIRYTDAAGAPSSIIAPPYDVIDENDRQRMLRENPHNIVRVDLAADGYDEAAARWSTWLRDGIVAREERPAFYAYRQTYDAPSGRRVERWGLTALVKLAAYDEGIVFPHERTLPHAKQDRLELMRATRTQLSPVFGMHFGARGSLDEMLADVCTHEPAVDITDADGVEHRLWVIDDPEVVNAIQAALAPAKIVIADGHHRYETALAFRDEQRAKYRGNDPADAAWNYVMMVLVDMDSPGLTVFPTHRVLHDVPGLTPETLEARLETAFRLSTVSLSSAGTGGRESVADTLTAALDELGDVPGFAVYSGEGRAFLARLADEAAWAERESQRPAAWRKLDVSVLHALALPALGVDEAAQASGEYLTFTRSAPEAVAAVEEGRAQAAVLVQPTPSMAVRDVALAGQSLPQKSTYYYPKLLTGLVMSELDSPVGL